MTISILRVDLAPTGAAKLEAVEYGDSRSHPCSPMTSIPLLGQQHPLINQLADRILHLWEAHLELEPFNLPEDLGFIEGRLEGERLVIENRCYQTPQFRKLHLELARIGSMLDILHCVMFPRPEYDLPIFGCDLVGGRGQISAAIADLSPVGPSLPPAYTAALQPWLARQAEFTERRELPPWGTIFSPYCLFVRPTNPEEEALFLDMADLYLSLHCQQAGQSDRVPGDRATHLFERQRHYCTQQQQNDKTRRVLEKAFGVEWAERYMTTVLFDLPVPVTGRSG